MSSQRQSKYTDGLLLKLPTHPRFVSVFPPGVEFFPITNPYKIALIPMCIPKKYFEHVRQFAGSAELNTPRIKSRFSGGVAETLLSKIRWACDAGANIICCSEYCYPILKDTDLRQDISNLSKTYRTYIIAGSYADTNPTAPTYNTCLIFTPSTTTFDPIFQYKNEQGKMRGEWEQIEVPPIPLQRIKILHTKYGTIAVMICAEIMNDNIRTGLRYINHNETIYEPIDLIIVPAYTSEPNSLQERCLYISDQAKTCVAYVNDMANDDFCNVYICGKEQCECLGSPKEEKNDTDYGTVHLYSINLDAIRNGRIKQYTEEPFIEKVG